MSAPLKTARRSLPVESILIDLQRRLAPGKSSGRSVRRSTPPSRNTGGTAGEPFDQSIPRSSG
ncbi:MAG: hypothetical protein ACK53L_30490, partial [Pirellulaceae bacterium]